MAWSSFLESVLFPTPIFLDVILSTINIWIKFHPTFWGVNSSGNLRLQGLNQSLPIKLLLAVKPAIGWVLPLAILLLTWLFRIRIRISFIFLLNIHCPNNSRTWPGAPLKPWAGCQSDAGHLWSWTAIHTQIDTITEWELKPTKSDECTTTPSVICKYDNNATWTATPTAISTPTANNNNLRIRLCLTMKARTSMPITGVGFHMLPEINRLREFSFALMRR